MNKDIVPGHYKTERIENDKGKKEVIEAKKNSRNNDTDKAYEENTGEIVIYQDKEGKSKIDVRFVDETVWLTQSQLCELYQTSKSNISEHIKNIFAEEELEEVSVVRKFRTTATDSNSRGI